MYFLLAGLVPLYEVWKVHKIGPQVWQNYTYGPWALLLLKTKRILIITKSKHKPKTSPPSSPNNKPGPIPYYIKPRVKPKSNPPITAYHCSHPLPNHWVTYQVVFTTCFHPPPHHSTHPLPPPPLWLQPTTINALHTTFPPKPLHLPPVFTKPPQIGLKVYPNLLLTLPHATKKL